MHPFPIISLPFLLTVNLVVASSVETKLWIPNVLINGQLLQASEQSLGFPDTSNLIAARLAVPYLLADIARFPTDVMDLVSSELQAFDEEVQQSVLPNIARLRSANKMTQRILADVPNAIQQEFTTFPRGKMDPAVLADHMFSSQSRIDSRAAWVNEHFKEKHELCQLLVRGIDRADNHIVAIINGTAVTQQEQGRALQAYERDRTSFVYFFISLFFGTNDLVPEKREALKTLSTLLDWANSSRAIAQNMSTWLHETSHVLGDRSPTQKHTMMFDMTLPQDVDKGAKLFQPETRHIDDQRHIDEL